MDRISLYDLDVTDEKSIKDNFGDRTYDFVIEDTTHQFEDQIRVIKNIYNNLNPGAILIIEDIFLSYDEDLYRKQLKDFEFSDFEFITFDHERRCSTGWNNDKILFLRKPGISKYDFMSNIKLTIITPSCRPENLFRVKDSIDFDQVKKWIIVYDRDNELKQFDDPKIEEYFCKDFESTAGNSQRNYALDIIANDVNECKHILHYLDDDNTLTKDFFKALKFMNTNSILTFDQQQKHRFLKGDKCEATYIDTAMYIVDFDLCRNFRWLKDLYQADGVYISEIYEANEKKHIYIGNTLATYNSLD